MTGQDAPSETTESAEGTPRRAAWWTLTLAALGVAVADLLSMGLAAIPAACLFLVGKQVWIDWFQATPEVIVEMSIWESLIIYLPWLGLALVPCIAANLAAARVPSVRRRWLMLPAAIAVILPLALELAFPGFIQGIPAWIAD
jgi:hypothetical protein